VATPKRPSKAELSKAGKALQNPRTREKDETKAAMTLAAGRKRRGKWSV
jgi:hypothetical protein